MLSRVIASSLVLAALANGLVFKRDDEYDSSTPPTLSIPAATPPPISLPGLSISLSLPSLDQSSRVVPTTTPPSSSSLPSVVTTTVYIYPTQCSPMPSGSPLPTAGPSGVPDKIVSLPSVDPSALPTPVQPTPINLPQEPPLNLPPVRRDDDTVSQLRSLQQYVVDTYVGLGKGDVMTTVVGQIESLIAQAVAPGANGPALLEQAQNLVNNQ